MLVPAEIQPLWQCEIKQLSEEILEQLLRTHLIVEPEKDQIALERLRGLRESSSGKLQWIYILTSQSCNLRCDYCVVDEASAAGRVRRKIMSVETAHTVAREVRHYVESNDIELLDIMFYGGEPLLGWAGLNTILEDLQGLDQVRFNMISNATLVTPQIAQILAAHNVNVGVSLDGPRVVTDVHRKFARRSDGSVYERANRGLQILLNEGVNAGLSVTLSDINEHGPSLRRWLEEECPAQPFFNLMQWGSDTPGAVEETRAQTDYLLSLRPLFHEKGWREDRVDRKLDAIKQRSFYFADCPAVTGGQITVLADGTVGICQVEASSTSQPVLGNLTRQPLAELMTNQKWADWRRISTLSNPTCLACPALPICGGGCPAEAFMMYGDRGALDRPFCAHSLAVLDWVLEQLAPKPAAPNRI